MKKAALLFFLFISLFSCQRKEFNETELITALVNHSYYPITPQQAQELVKKGKAEIKKLDKNFEIIKIKGRERKEGEKAKKERIFYFPFILKKHEDRYLIIKVFDYSIAYEAGLRTGIVNSIDGKALPDNPSEANSYISKKDVLNLSFNDGRADWKIVVKKEIDVFPFVWSAMINSDTAYVNILSLSKNSSTFFKNNLTNLIKRGAKKIILDLREVAGGNYDEAARIIGFFSKDRKNYFIKSSKEGYSKSFETTENIFKDLKLVVLIDRKTAILGEVMAQSLKEWGAIIVGENTKGRVYITKLFKVANDAAAQLSVAKLYPPSGVDIENGVTPDFTMIYPEYKKYGIPYVIDCDPLITKAEEILRSF